MGSPARPPNGDGNVEEKDDSDRALGDLLSGRFADVRVDSVEVVRDVRERE